MSDRKGYEWWDKFCRLPRYSFIKAGEYDAVTRWENPGGVWVDRYEAGVIVDAMQEEINALSTEVAALKNRQGMKIV